MGAPHGPLKKAVAQPKPDKTGPLPRTLKIEITGGPESGKEKMARRIIEMLQRDLIYSNRVTCQLKYPEGGNPDTVAVEGPDDATFLVIVTGGEPK